MKRTLRGLMFMVALAGIGVLCLNMPTLALADDTPAPCSALKRIVAAAPGGFVSLQPGDANTVAQPYGQDAQCAAKGGTLTCTWTKAADSGSTKDALQAVAADIASCLPEATHDQNSAARQHFYIGERGEAESRAQITATTAGASKLSLAVSGK